MVTILSPLAWPSQRTLGLRCLALALPCYLLCGSMAPGHASGGGGYSRTPGPGKAYICCPSCPDSWRRVKLVLNDDPGTDLCTGCDRPWKRMPQWQKFGKPWEAWAKQRRLEQEVAASDSAHTPTGEEADTPAERGGPGALATAKALGIDPSDD